MLISQSLIAATEQLANYSDSPRLDAEVLLAFSLNKNRTWLATWPDKTLNTTEQSIFYALLDRRLEGEPIAHITGSREFWSLDLTVNKDTLIPRPETELMVEKILQLYPAHSQIQLLDLGTGSGAIALAIASERPDWKITATDKSTGALDIAKQNAQHHKLNNISFIESDWLTSFSNQRFNIIASNPPYIANTDPHLSRGDLRFEPVTALTSGADGLDDIQLICQQARSHLLTNGLLIIEHGYDQKEKLNQIFTYSGYKNIQQYNDLSSNPRITCGINL